MKSKMKFAALLTALLIAVPMFAQKVDQKIMNKAKGRIENMCQTVKLDDDTKQKVLDLSYQQMLAMSNLWKQKSTMPEDEFKATIKKSGDEYWKSMQSMIPKDQLAAYKAWKSQPQEKRDAAPSQDN